VEQGDGQHNSEQPHPLIIGLTASAAWSAESLRAERRRALIFDLLSVLMPERAGFTPAP